MHWKLKGRIAGTLILAGLFVSANSTPIASFAATSNPSIQLAAIDTAMHDAETAARDHLGRFLALVANDAGAAMTDASLKVAITESGKMAWVVDFSKGGAGFVGTVARAPSNVPDLNPGDTLRFSEDHIRDWSFIGQDGKLYGSYTTRAILPRLTSKQVSQIAGILSPRPTPVNW